MCSGSETCSCLRLIDVCITQRYGQVAAERGRAEEAEALCGAGADPDVRNGYAQTPAEVRAP